MCAAAPRMCITGCALQGVDAASAVCGANEASCAASANK